MNKIWEAFENLQEIVYVVDAKEYDLVYMNQLARSTFNCSRTEDYRGRKCYELLQGLPEPCRFCSDARGKGTYALKETLIEQDGRTYRLETAVDIAGQEEAEHSLFLLLENEAIVNECLRRTLADEDAGEALEELISYLGDRLECDRAYIFEELRAGRICNTYEWCAPSASSEKASFQYATWNTVEPWLPVFERDQCVVVEDVEELKDINPLEYNWLKAQDTKTAVVCPLFDGGKLMGFCGVDNPPRERVRHISAMLQVIRHFIVVLMKRRDKVRRLRHMSFHDPLTGVLNRYAMEEMIASQTGTRPLGVVYCDISGLKTINDSQGHAQGDQMILSASQLLAEHFPAGLVYRIGGDEFAVLCRELDEDRAHRLMSELEDKLAETALDNDMRLSLSCGFAIRKPGEALSNLVRRADVHMYEMKREHRGQKNRPRNQEAEPSA